jgi:hypothetical protein
MGHSRRRSLASLPLDVANTDTSANDISKANKKKVSYSSCDKVRRVESDWGAAAVRQAARRANWAKEERAEQRRLKKAGLLEGKRGVFEFPYFYFARMEDREKNGRRSS